MTFWNPSRQFDAEGSPPPKVWLGRVRKPIALSHRNIAVSFFWAVVMPTVLWLAWMTLIESPHFTSEFRVVVRAPQASSNLDISTIMGLSAPARSSQDAYAVIQYLKSQQATMDLQESAKLRERYSKPTIDFASRLSANPTQAMITRYWGRRLDAYFENTTGTIVARVSAFDPQDAQALAQASLHLSEQLVNQMSGRARSDLVRYATNDLEKAAGKMRAVERELFELRNHRGLLDPGAVAATNQQRQLDLQRRITETRAQISTTGHYIHATSPMMDLLRRQLASLEVELSSVRAESTTRSDETEALSSSMREFDQLQAEQVFAQKTYQAAAEALTAARGESVRQQLYLDTIVPPTLPDEKSGPRILRNTLTALAMFVALWVIALMAVRSVQDRF